MNTLNPILPCDTYKHCLYNHIKHSQFYNKLWKLICEDIFKPNTITEIHINI